MNQQLKQGLGGAKPSPGKVTGEIKPAQAVTGYETCVNAVTQRKDQAYHDPKNSGMPDQNKGGGDGQHSY